MVEDTIADLELRVSALERQVRRWYQLTICAMVILIGVMVAAIVGALDEMLATLTIGGCAFIWLALFIVWSATSTKSFELWQRLASLRFKQQLAKYK